ncbi:MAG: hypothetical protein KY475_10690 [Planctomycetes bacterium]|nr:hypothetical protein [Planctomycetota bacterium]
MKPDDVRAIDVLGKVRIAKDKFRVQGAAGIEDLLDQADPLRPQDFERVPGPLSEPVELVMIRRNEPYDDAVIGIRSSTGTLALLMGESGSDDVRDSHFISEVPAEDIRETAAQILRDGYEDLEGLRIRPM